MATATIRAESACEKPYTQLHDLGLQVQKVARRISVLTEAVDDLGERLVPEPDAHKLKALGMIDDIMNMIGELATEARDCGEKIEVLSGRLSYREDLSNGK